jgi:acetyltransferase EpsM
MNKICLFGASGHGKVIKDVALSSGHLVEAFFDDNPKVQFIDDVPVFKFTEISDCKEKTFLISIGSNILRKKLSEKFSLDYDTLIHDNAVISETVAISLGTVIMAGVIINANTNIGRHVIVNTSAVIEHDCVIDDFVHISPSATITGNVSIGEGTHIGAGAIVIPNVKIGKWVIIGAGTVVIKDVPDFAIVVGNPGRIKKYNNK